jgi:type II secretory pathway component GspD/PulD (secretin)
MKFYLLLFLTFSLNANDVFLPKKKVDLSRVPGYISDLVEDTNKRMEERRLKEFGQTVEEIVKSNDEELEQKAEELIKDKNELDKFLVAAKSEKLSKKYLNDVEIEKMLALQYQDEHLLNNKISLKLKNADIKEVVELIGKSADLDFIIDSSVVGNIGNINFKDINISNALKIILSSNNPKLALINDNGVFRIMNKKDALPILKIHKTEIRQNSLVSDCVTIFNAKWTETFKLRVEKMWYGILGSSENVKGYYLVFDDETKKIFFKGEKQEVLELKKYLSQIDDRIPQIRIDTRVVIAAKDFEESFGFQVSGVYNRSSSISNGWNYAGAGPVSTGGQGDFPAGALNNWALNLLPDAASKFLNFPAIFGGKDLDSKRLNLVLNAAENKSIIETILKPTLLVNSNEPAEILVGQEIPIETSVQESIQNTLRNVNTINYKDLGMKLRVKPTVQPDQKTVFLDIYVEHSYIKDSSTSFDSKTSIIAVTKSKNRVILNSGQTTLIGGLISNERRKTKNGIPILQSIPGIGWLFSGRRKVKADDQLMIFITPTII